MAKRGLVPIPSEEASLDYKDASNPTVADRVAEWTNVPGVGSFRETGGDAPTRDVVAFEGTATLTGRSRVPTVECDVSAYLPYLKPWRDIRTAALAQRALEFRLQTPKDTIFTGDGTTTAAIAAGVLTLAGGNPPDLLSPQYAPGVCVEAGSELFVIESIVTKLTANVLAVAADGTFSSAATSALSSTTDWSLTRPVLIRGPFAAKVANTDRSQLASESNLLSALRLQPLANLPQWIPVITVPTS